MYDIIHVTNMYSVSSIHIYSIHSTKVVSVHSCWNGLRFSMIPQGIIMACLIEQWPISFWHLLPSHNKFAPYDFFTSVLKTYTIARQDDLSLCLALTNNCFTL